MQGPSWIHGAHVPAERDAEADLSQARHAHLAAIEDSIRAARAFRDAAPGERAGAHRRLRDAVSRQSAAEHAYERARQAASGAPYAGRHRILRWP